MAENKPAKINQKIIILGVDTGRDSGKVLLNQTEKDTRKMTYTEAKEKMAKKIASQTTEMLVVTCDNLYRELLGGNQHASIARAGVIRELAKRNEAVVNAFLDSDDDFIAEYFA